MFDHETKTTFNNVIVISLQNIKALSASFS